MARPSKFSADVRQKIIHAIRGGANRDVAARFAGIADATLYQLARGKRQRVGEFREFAEAVQQADAEAEVEAVLRIRQSALGGEIVGRKTTTKTTREGGSVTTTDESFSRPEWQAVGPH